MYFISGKVIFCKRNNRKILIRLSEVSLFIILSLILFSCQKATDESNEKSSAKSASENQEDILWTEKDEASLDRLLKKFTVIKDAATNNIWYSHKSIPQLGTNLFCEVNSTGNYCYLISMYYKKKNLFHESVQIKFDTYTASTENIPLNDRRNRESSYKNSAMETIHFTEGTDNDIHKLIALNYNKNISVTLKGQKNNYEYFLSNEMKRSIKDSYELLEMLKRKSSTPNKF